MKLKNAMGNEKNTVLSDEQLKEVTGGAMNYNVYCASRLTMESCQSAAVCKWSMTGKHEDPITGQIKDGVCIVK